MKYINYKLNLIWWISYISTYLSTSEKIRNGVLQTLGSFVKGFLSFLFVFSPPTFASMKLSNKEVMVEYFAGRRKREELTDFQLDYLDRIKACYSMMLEAKRKSAIIRMLQELHGVAESGCYKLYAETEEIFGGTTRANKEIKRHIAEEMAKEAWRRAKKIKKVPAMINALNAYIRATGIEEQDPEIPDMQKLEPGVIVTLLPPELEQRIVAQLKEGYVNFNGNVEQFDIATYEEVPDTGEGRTAQESHTGSAQPQ